MQAVKMYEADYAIFHVLGVHSRKDLERFRASLDAMQDRGGRTG